MLNRKMQNTFKIILKIFIIVGAAGLLICLYFIWHQNGNGNPNLVENFMKDYDTSREIAIKVLEKTESNRLEDYYIIRSVITGIWLSSIFLLIGISGCIVLCKYIRNSAKIQEVQELRVSIKELEKKMEIDLLKERKVELERKLAAYEKDKGI